MRPLRRISTSLLPTRRSGDRSLKEVLAAVEAAAVLHARYFVIHPGPEETNLPLGEERTQRLANASLALGVVAERCWQLGMMCVLENKLPHLLFGDIRDMMWILEAMKTTHVGICLDTGHAHLAGDLWNAPHKLATSLKMIHASDNKGRHDDHLPPGEGEMRRSRVATRTERVQSLCHPYLRSGRSFP